MNDSGATAAAVLIAEDEPLASMALRAQVEALGHDVLAAARDGDEALALGRCLPVDLAVFDQRMPGRSGLDAAILLFEMEPTPVLLLTGFGSADLPDPIPEPPVFAVLTKPIGLDELRRGIQRTRERFDAWVERENLHDRVRRSHHARTITARAVDTMTTGHARAAAALELLRRADVAGCPPDEMARQVLDTED